MTGSPLTAARRCRVACSASLSERVPKASGTLSREQAVSALSGLLISRM